MRARQLVSIHHRGLRLRKEGVSIFRDDLKIKAEALSLHNHPPRNLSDLITCIVQSLMSLDIHGIHGLMTPCKTKVITIAQFQEKYARVNSKCKIALNRLAALVSLPSTEELSTEAIQKILAQKNTEANLSADHRSINNTHISSLIVSFF